MKKFDTCRPIAFELRFRSERARHAADAILERGNIQRGGSIEEVDSMTESEDGFGCVTVKVMATSERNAQRDLERVLGKVGDWVDRSEGEYGEDGILIFVPK